MKSTDLLTQEHKLILRALDVLDSVTEPIQKGAPPASDDVDKLLDFLRWFADAHHQAKEERILFTAVKACAAAEDRPVRHLMFEHDQERKSIEELEKELRVGQLPQFVASAERLSSTLRNHIYKEERLLFPEVDKLLSGPEDEAIVRQLEQFETPMDRHTLEYKLKELHELEWKYLRK